MNFNPPYCLRKRYTSNYHTKHITTCTKKMRGWVPSNLDLSWEHNLKNLSIIGQFMALIKHLAVMVIHCILKGMDVFC